MWAFPAFAAAALALFIERLVGYPTYLLDGIGHPVIWVGKLITWLDAHLNRNALSPADGRLRGVLALVVPAPAHQRAGQRRVHADVASRRIDLVGPDDTELGFMPFVVLEAVWCLVAAAALVKRVRMPHAQAS